MADDPLLARAREVWLELAGVPMAFPADGDGVEVAVSAGSRLCPPGWVGIVALGDAAIATVPVVSWAGIVRNVLDELPVAVLTDADRLRAVLPVAQVLGPASLAYLDECDFQPAGPFPWMCSPGSMPISPHFSPLARRTTPTNPGWRRSPPARSWCAAGLTLSRRLATGAGPGRWPTCAYLPRRNTAGVGWHVSLPPQQSRTVLANQLLPQWRARPASSRRVARALGFRQLGGQLCVRIGA